MRFPVLPCPSLLYSLTATDSADALNLVRGGADAKPRTIALYIIAIQAAVYSVSDLFDTFFGIHHPAIWKLKFFVVQRVKKVFETVPTLRLYISTENMRWGISGESDIRALETTQHNNSNKGAPPHRHTGQKSAKSFCCSVSDFKAAPNSISVGAPPQTPLGELTALSRPPSWM